MAWHFQFVLCVTIYYTILLDCIGLDGFCDGSKDYNYWIQNLLNWKVRRLHFKRAFQWHKSLFTNLSESCLSDLQIDTNSHLDSIAVFAYFFDNTGDPCFKGQPYNSIKED